jgi:two-component system, OmpR family, response regulator
VQSVRILIVEDNERVRDVVGSSLRAAGHSIAMAPGYGAALEFFEQGGFDLAIVDIGLPDGSGIELCRQARRSGHELPILLLTAHTDVTDRVAGLDAGADDYLGKPFSSEELSARVRALGRRGPRWTESVKRFADVVIDRDRRTVVLRGAPVPLTPREFEIVAVLAWRNGRVVARDEILELVWGETSDKASSSLEVLVARIRRKLAGTSEVIRTVRQTGYAWALEPSKPH